MGMSAFGTRPLNDCLPFKESKAYRKKHEAANHIRDKLLRCKAERTTCFSRKLWISPTGTGEHRGQNHCHKIVRGRCSRAGA